MIQMYKNNQGVYFILNEETKLIKIGCSKDIYKRLDTLQKQIKHLGYNSKLKLIGCIECSNYQYVEKEIHEYFKNRRYINEWFNISLEEANMYIDKYKINKNKNDIGLIENKNDGKIIALEYKYIKRIRNKLNSYDNGLDGNDLVLISIFKELDSELSIRDLLDIIPFSERTLRNTVEKLIKNKILSARTLKKNKKIYKLKEARCPMDNLIFVNVEILNYIKNKKITTEEFSLYLLMKYKSKDNKLDLPQKIISDLFFRKNNNQTQISKLIKNLDNNNIIQVIKYGDNNGFYKSKYILNY